MKALVSGGTGLVGRYIVEGLLTSGYRVIVGGRRPPPGGWFSQPVGFVPLLLDPEADQIEAFDDAYFFIHAAFDHVPRKYRGGEGDDPDRFRKLNLDGTVRLFETARKAGTRRAVFLSSRAVYDGLPAGTALTEDLALEPQSLYGEIKLLGETALAALSAPGFATASLRLTGVYGHFTPNKWDGLFADYLAGKPVPPRAGTEVHGHDVASAVRLMLEAEAGRIDRQAFNVSDILVDTRDILSALPDRPHELPSAADRGAINLMSTDKIETIGWRPGGEDLFRETIREIAAAFSPTG
ncbi:NAD(P)-dependent oxidoreductase [Rhizobium sp. LCM 4573]|uniref:NAD-dependent epimerase/dehydratase family protein n=1 Tax=Rhizobium sp. LCM 4573 TaxID=1848291 RepID=UPI0008D94FBD|nr:NAD(P)-dependent oxidoreductase [Rhizobium sp. LCM 4573]OHV84586.1 UDP-glucose 4-epimerase [Rhizobium sp. LCM 4573]